jgi:hypothetical protein
MFKRRLAVLGAVCALALTGLAGSALADEPPSTAGAKVTCKTSDGKTFELPAGEPAGVVVTPDGQVKKVDPGEMAKLAVPAEKLPDGAEPPVLVKKDGAEPTVQVERIEGAEVPSAMAKADAVPGVPGIKAEDGVPGPPAVGEAPDGVHDIKVTIACEKPE